MSDRISRREALAVAASLGAGRALGADAHGFRLSTFVAEVSPPPRHPLMAGGIAPAAKVEDPLFAHGLVLLGAGKPIGLVAVDWCEIRNDAHDRWRQAVADALRTDARRVLVSCVHQHDAPVADLEAERLLRTHQAAGSICDPGFHEQAVRRVARAAAACLDQARRVTHLGTGQARVSAVASNRRYPGPDGKPRFDRTSATRDANVREQPEGTIDPWLKALSFWDGDRPVAVLSCYATHPMSSYGTGGVSADFVGLARQRRQADDPAVFQLYGSGCSGNVTAGKYHDGSADNRPLLAERLYQAMAAAWKATERQPLQGIDCRGVPLRLEPRGGEGFTVEDLAKRLTTDPRPFGQCLAALGLSWRKRAGAGHQIDVPVIDLGAAQLLLLPGESYVEFQLAAQRLRPDSFVMTLGYGECAPGYVPTERAFQEGDGNLRDWCWVAPGAEEAMTKALGAALQKP
jgi:hypothetical protein